MVNEGLDRVEWAGLDDEQRAAVTAPPGPVCVLAGAGTGKTRTVTHRIAHMITSGAFRPGEILAVTFTTRAAGEMRVRLRALGAEGVQARTFHSAALRQLRYFWPRAVGGEMWEVLEHKMRLVAAAARRCGAGSDTALLRDLASEIEWAKASLVAPDGYAEAVALRSRAAPLPAQQVSSVYAAYEEAKTTARQLDFDDLLLHVCAVLENDAEAARTFRARYRFFVVDEFQDVTPLQNRTLDAWLGGRDSVTVVGDANQTIYTFAGASPQYLLRFGQRYPHATIARLQRDYRSTPQVVQLANRVIASARGGSAALRLTLTAGLADGPPVRFDEYADDPAEAEAVARSIAALTKQGVPLSSIAVLYRINAQSEIYEKALAQAGIAYRVRGGERFFARPEVRQALGVLERAARQDDAGAGPDPRSQASGEGALVPTVRELLRPVGLTEAPPAPGAVRERWDSLSALVSVAEELAAADAQVGLNAFVAELRERAAGQHAPSVDGVTLASFHAAKGLEWDAVFLVGLTDGLLPIQHASSDEAIEEERRLFYVGITRARTRLALSWALARNSGGRRTRKRTRFLDGAMPERIGAAVDSATAARRGRARRCRSCGAELTSAKLVKAGRCSSCAAGVDDTLFEALRTWRREQADAVSVPAYVVFSDATLYAIADRRPADPAGLLSIPGIGRSKLDRFGADVLRIVEEAGGRPEGGSGGR